MAVMMILQRRKTSKLLNDGLPNSKVVTHIFTSSVEEDDADGWDFGTVKQAPPQLSKPPLQQMHHSPSQYSVNSFSTENKYQQQPPQQLPRTVSRNQVTPQQQQQPAPSSRVNEVTVSICTVRASK